VKNVIDRVALVSLLGGRPRRASLFVIKSAGFGCFKTEPSERREMKKRYKKNKKKELKDRRKFRMKVREETRDRPGGKSHEKRKVYRPRSYPNSINQPDHRPSEHSVLTVEPKGVGKAPQVRQINSSEKAYIQIAKSWKRLRTGDLVDGLEVLGDIPNTSSIGAELGGEENYDVIGVRAVPIEIFTLRAGEVGLAKKIKESGKIKPLIVVVDGHEDGIGYILEGSHRIDALKYLGVSHIPALVVVVL
jgi:hypothetical protein